MTRTRLWLGGVSLLLAVAAALALGAGRDGARAAGASDLLPNLVSDPPNGAFLQDYAYGDGTRDLLLRFNGYVHNTGAGALDVRGSRAGTSDPMTPLQRVYRTDSTYHDDPMPGAQLIYVDADGHHHWHLQDVARYTLWNQAKTQEVAPAMKVGFCLDDSQHVDGFGPSTGVYTDANGRAFCQQNNPGALSLFEGVSSGWRDIYSSSLSYQWVVASDVQPGVYWLREDVDPDAIVHESNETNPPAYSSSSTTIPGYVAKGIFAPAAPFGQRQQVTLDADTYGSPGARSFRVVTPPAHGTLDVATGAAFTGPTVTYIPSPGYTGPDSFTYAARDSASPYPIHPGTATVSLSVGPPGPSVVIDSAPSSVQTGHGVQLHATVANDLPGVTWSVDGVDGGSSAFGTITPSGFFTAPASVPAGGTVTIAARSASGAHDQRKVAITPPPLAQAAPAPPGSGSSTAHSRLGPLSVGLAGHVLVASVTTRRAGVLAISARVGRRHLGRCRARVPAGRHFACRMRVPRHLSLRKLSVVARLTLKGKVLARRTRVGSPLAIHRSRGLRAAGTLGLSQQAQAFLHCSL